MKNDIFSFEFSTQIGKFFSPERELHMMWTLYLYNCHVTCPVVDLRPNSRLSNTLYGKYPPPSAPTIYWKISKKNS